MKTALILSDVHVPFEDKRKYALALDIARINLNNIEEIILLGDFADTFTLMSHKKDISLKKNIPNFLIQELEKVCMRLDELDDKFKGIKKIYIEGNHENRLYRYIRDNASEFFGLIDFPSIFNIEKRKDWSWISYSPDQFYNILDSNLFARHEPIGPNARTTAQRSMTNVIFGHIHRAEHFQTVSLSGQKFNAYSCHWLGNKNTQAMQYVKNHHQWSNGFAVINVKKKNDFTVEQIPIFDDNTCIFRGKIYGTHSSIRTKNSYQKNKGSN